MESTEYAFGLMVMGVFAEIRNGFECFCKMRYFRFPDLGKEKLCSVLIFGNVCFNIVVQINHCLLYTSPSPRDGLLSRMPSSA